MLFTPCLQRFPLCWGVGSESIQSDHRFGIEFARVRHMAFQVHQPGLQGFEVFAGEVTLCHTTIELQRPNGSYDDDSTDVQIAGTSLDVKEFFRTQI